MAEGRTRRVLNRLLRLTLLAPDVQEAILDGRQTKGMQLEELTRTMPMGWEEQRRRLSHSGSEPERITDLEVAWGPLSPQEAKDLTTGSAPDRR